MDRARIVAQDAPYDPWPQAMTVSEETSCYTAQKQGCGDKIPTFGARGQVFAPAKPAFPPSMAVAEPRISCHAVAAQPARQGWHTTCLATKMSLPPKNHYHSRTLQMVFIMSNITPPNMKNPIHLLAFGLGSGLDRKSTRLNSSHVKISYAVF